VVEASLTTYGRHAKYALTDQKWYKAEYDSKHSEKPAYSNFESVSLYNTKIRYRHRVNPHRNNLGDYFMDEIGTYEDILRHLQKITFNRDENIQNNNEKLIAQWMMRYASTGQALSLQELQNMSANATQNDLNTLHRIFYHCLIKEISCRMLPGDESRDLPLATAQARAIKLLANGHLHLKDVFAQDAPYGVFTGKEIMKGENFEQLKRKIARIDRKYFAFLHQEPIEENTDANYILQLFQPRQSLHNDLLEFYGGDNDTAGEGYDSDTAEKEYSGVFKFGKN